MVRFGTGAGILIGGLLGTGALVARGVTFSTAETPPKPGAWDTIHFLGDASGDLEGTILEYGGGNGPVVIAAGRSPAELRISRCTFRDNAAPAIGAPRSCARWLNGSLGNVSLGQPPCAVVH